MIPMINYMIQLIIEIIRNGVIFLKQEIIQKQLSKLKDLQNLKIPKNAKFVRLHIPMILQDLNEALAFGLRSEKDQFDEIKEGSDLSLYTLNATDKWHYFQSVNKANIYVMESHDENAMEDPNLQWWNSYETMPCFIEVLIPEMFLLPSLSYLNMLEDKGELKKHVSWKDSLKKHGTVSMMGFIPREWIVSFTIMADGKLLYEELIGPSNLYMKEYIQWVDTGAKGSLQNAELMMRIQKSNMIGTWYMEQMPELFTINEVQISGEKKQIEIKIQSF